MPSKEGFDHSKWEDASLSKDQLEYAAADAIVVLRIVALSEQPPNLPMIGPAAVGADITKGAELHLQESDGASDSTAHVIDEQHQNPQLSNDAVKRHRRRSVPANAGAIDDPVLQGVIENLPDGSEDDDECDDDEPQIHSDSGAPGLMEHCIRHIEDYACSARTDLVRLPSGVSVADRKKLHDLCSTYGLWHSSSGVAGVDSSDRTLTFQRRFVFQPVCEAFADEAVGYVLATRSSGCDDCVRGVVEHYELHGDGPRWRVRDEGSNGLRWVNLQELNAQLKLRADVDATLATERAPLGFHPLPVALADAADDRLAALQAKVPENWHELDAQTTPQDLRHFLTNIMRMCAAKPGDYAWKVCVSDLTSVFFKPMKGERERLLRDMKRRFPEENIRHYGRSYFRRFTRCVCPPPREQLQDFFDWYRFWSTFPHPTMDGRTMFTADSWAIFKHECTYIQQGFTSDPPGMNMYVLVRTTKYGRDIYRCLRSSSQVEGWHNFLIRNTDVRARASGQRAKDACLRGSRDVWNVRSAVKAGVIPCILHHRVYLRDMLCDIVRGSPLEAMVALKGWRRVDQSLAPTVPVGYGVPSRGPGASFGELSRTPLGKHSSVTAFKYAVNKFGQPEASTLLSYDDKCKVLAKPAALLSATTNVGAYSSMALFNATGVLPTSSAVKELPGKMLEHTKTAAALVALNHVDLRGRLQRPANSWQIGERHVFARVEPSLGVAAPLPAGFFGGTYGPKDVLVGCWQPAMIPELTYPKNDVPEPKTRAEKEKERKRNKRARETLDQHSQRLENMRTRARMRRANDPASKR